MSDFSELKGRVITRVNGLKEGSEEVVFECSDGSKWRMHHYQDCCESVCVEDVNGDVSDLTGEAVLEASERSEYGVESNYESSTWTFYHISTIRGTVVIRWIGVSNGYYSESVSFEKVA